MFYGKILFFVLPAPTVWILLKFNPFDSPEGTSPEYLSLIPLALLISGQVLFMRLLLTSKTQKELFRKQVFYTVWAMFWSSLLGVLVHPDFISCNLMYMTQASILYIDSVLGLPTEETNRLTFSRLYIFGLTIAILITIWLMLMGFALVTRQEPRWWEALIYNIINGVLCFLIFARSMNLASLRSRVIQTSSVSFLVDGLDFTQVLGERGCVIAHLLLKSTNGVTCKTLSTTWQGCANTEECTATKASACMGYRSTYNTIRLVRSLFEALHLGTIQSSGKRREIVKDGWIFLPQAKLEIQNSVPSNLVGLD